MLPTKPLEYVSLGIPCVVPRTGTICRYFDEEMVQFFENGRSRTHSLRRYLAFIEIPSAEQCLLRWRRRAS